MVLRPGKFDLPFMIKRKILRECLSCVLEKYFGIMDWPL